MVTMHFYKSLDNLCFSDFHVLDITIDTDDKTLEINLEGAWLIVNGSEPKELGKGAVKIKNFKEIQPKYSNCLKKTEGMANIEEIKQLKEIDDHKVGNNFMEIYGFINDGSWLECKIVGGSVEAEFED